MLVDLVARVLGGQVDALLLAQGLQELLLAGGEAHHAVGLSERVAQEEGRRKPHLPLGAPHLEVGERGGLVEVHPRRERLAARAEKQARHLGHEALGDEAGIGEGAVEEIDVQRGAEQVRGDNGAALAVDARKSALGFEDQPGAREQRIEHGHGQGAGAIGATCEALQRRRKWHGRASGGRGLGVRSARKSCKSCAVGMR